MEQGPGQKGWGEKIEKSILNRSQSLFFESEGTVMYMALGLYRHTNQQHLFGFGDIKYIRRKLNHIRTTESKEHQGHGAAEDVGGWGGRVGGDEDDSGPCDHWGAWFCDRPKLKEWLHQRELCCVVLVQHFFFLS